jgi:hypothetical protein
MPEGTLREFGVRCTTARGEDVLVTTPAWDPDDALARVRGHIRLFYGSGDGAGRVVAERNAETLVSAHEAKPLEDWEAEGDGQG